MSMQLLEEEGGGEKKEIIEEEEEEDVGIGIDWGVASHNIVKLHQSLTLSMRIIQPVINVLQFYKSDGFILSAPARPLMERGPFVY